MSKNCNPHKIIPISFNMYQVLENKFYLENNSCNDRYLIQTRSQATSDGIKLPEVHGVRKSLNPNLRPEKQHAISKQGNLERLHIGQGSIKQDMTHAQSSQRSNMKNVNPNINFDFEENSPFQEGIMCKCSKDWTNHSFRNLEN